MSPGQSLATMWLHQHIRAEEGLPPPSAHAGKETLTLTADQIDQIVMAARLMWTPLGEAA
jgi:hypothetical protein